ncbi:hypothetical protein [Streptomyces sp. NPDC018000]|uniref:hypothetical protein n=1 Tax=Streptomyces sp. NPDC018000 TaxID=3365028 RepID=UPI0037B20DE1
MRTSRTWSSWAWTCCAAAAGLRPRVRLAAFHGEPLRGALGLAASAATGTWTLPTDEALLTLTHFDHVDG